MAKKGKMIGGNSTRISATILLFCFWVGFAIIYTMLISPNLPKIQNFLILFSSLLLFALGVVYAWSPVIDDLKKREKKKKRRR